MSSNLELFSLEHTGHLIVDFIEYTHPQRSQTLSLSNGTVIFILHVDVLDKVIWTKYE